MIEFINFLSRKQAEQLQPEGCDVLVSISEPGSPLPQLKGGWGEVLSVQFWDIVDPLARDGELYPVITADQAKEIADFIRHWHGRSEKVRFTAHCLAGVSRSAAVALSAYDYTTAAFARRQLAYNANLLVVRRVNEALGLPGYDIPTKVEVAAWADPLSVRDVW